MLQPVCRSRRFTDGKLLERTRYVWDGDTLAHAIRTRAAATGAAVVEERTYCFEDGSFVPWAHCETKDDRFGLRGSAWAFYFNDPIGTPEELVDGAGEVLAELDRDAWGRTQERDGARASTPLRFQGQYEDAETGLFYNRFRYYDPDAGLFLSPDPLGLSGGLRPFGYVPNPTGWVDPYGLVFARLYKRDEVRRMLDASEGRSPSGGPPGHAQGLHGNVTDAALQARADHDNKGPRTAHRTCPQQVRATYEALNSRQGQADLAKLDADPTKLFVDIKAPVRSAARVSVPGGTGAADGYGKTQFIRVYRLPGDRMHIQTSYPKI